MITLRQKHFEPMTSAGILDVVSGIKVPDRGQIVVILDDFTRPCTAVSQLVLNHLFGITDFDYNRISILFANGMHRAMTLPEMTRKVGIQAATHCRMYQNNPFVQSSPFLRHPDDYYRIGIGCVMPHSFAGISGGNKLLVPGCASIDVAMEYHQGRIIMDMPEPDVMVQYTVNTYCQPIHMKLGYIDNLNGVYDVTLPHATDLAILEPTYKNADILQAINALTVFRQHNPIRKNGYIAIKAECPDGIGTHYLFQKGGPLHDAIDRKGVFAGILNGRQLVFITNVPQNAIQEYFKSFIYVVHDEETLHSICGYDDAIRIIGADMLIGRSLN